MKRNPPLSERSSKSTLELDRFPGGWCHRDRNEWQEVLILRLESSFDWWTNDGSVGRTVYLPTWMVDIYVKLVGGYTIHGSYDGVNFDAIVTLLQDAGLSPEWRQTFLSHRKKPFISLRVSHVSFSGAKKGGSHFSAWWISSKSRKFKKRWWTIFYLK